MSYLKKGLSFYLYFYKNQIQEGPCWWIYAWFGLLIFFPSIHAPITCGACFLCDKSTINDISICYFLLQNMYIKLRSGDVINYLPSHTVLVYFSPELLNSHVNLCKFTMLVDISYDLHRNPNHMCIYTPEYLHSNVQ